MHSLSAVTGKDTMTAGAEQMLLHSIMPTLLGLIGSGRIRTVGSEDAEELGQDAIATACRMLAAAEKNHKTVTASNIVHYTCQALKSGRRSGSASRTDVYSPGAALDGRSALMSVHEPVGSSDGDDEFTLLDTLAGPGEDPSSQAGRNCDWSDLDERLDWREKSILKETSEGYSGKHLAAGLGISTGRVCQLKDQVARKVKAAWGDDALINATASPGWRKQLRTYHEQKTCRAERLSAHA